jgi:uncharacterized membrane protein
MLVAGTGHFTNTHAFLAQVPPFLPAREFIVQASGVVEIAIALALLFARKQLPVIGVLLAVFYVLVFPGNISQYLTHTSAFGLDTDGSRAVRLLFQPVLIAWALWCTQGWRERDRAMATIRSWLRL